MRHPVGLSTSSRMWKVLGKGNPHVVGAMGSQSLKISSIGGPAESMGADLSLQPVASSRRARVAGFLRMASPVPVTLPGCRRSDHRPGQRASRFRRPDHAGATMQGPETHGPICRPPPCTARGVVRHRACRAGGRPTASRTAWSGTPRSMSGHMPGADWFLEELGGTVALGGPRRRTWRTAGALVHRSPGGAGGSTGRLLAGQWSAGTSSSACRWRSLHSVASPGAVPRWTRLAGRGRWRPRPFCRVNCGTASVNPAGLVALRCARRAAPWSAG